jgi:hypothetical protein
MKVSRVLKSERIELASDIEATRYLQIQPNKTPGPENVCCHPSHVPDLILQAEGNSRTSACGNLENYAQDWEIPFLYA